jgi:hypothetical protein
MCPICGQHLTVRDRGPHQQWLEDEYVCLDIDCLEFGIYKAARAWAVAAIATGRCP